MRTKRSRLEITHNKSINYNPAHIFPVIYAHHTIFCGDMEQQQQQQQDLDCN